ncbi:hypothetical protein QE152_g34264 [Popillia japonica]|uniref:Uncharacterized protein n=1 Tax=Popillia japonica TaxID=7064 RepID=A0AAW1IUI6_POPJA
MTLQLFHFISGHLTLSFDIHVIAIVFRMLAVRSLVKTGAAVAAQQSRQMSVVATRPLVRVSFAEKLVHGVIMTVAYCTIPVWVLVNIRNYRGLGK